MNKVLIAIIIAWQLIITYLFFFNEQKALQPEIPNQIALLSEKQKALENKLAQIHIELSSIQLSPPQHHQAQNKVSSTKKQESPSVSHEEDLSEKSSAPSEPLPQPNSSEKVENRFLEEKVDPLWAYEYESNILTTFTNNSELQDYNIKQVKCHTNICQIQIYSTGENNLTYGLSIGKVLSEQKWYAKDSELHFNYKDNNGVFNMYLDKSAK